VGGGCNGNIKPRDFPEQILVCGCGESSYGTGKAYFDKWDKVCDYDEGYVNNGPLHGSYAHLHFTPPHVATINGVADEAVQMLTSSVASEPSPAVFVHGNCAGPRGKLVKGMIDSNIVQIDRWGTCWKNRDVKAENIEPTKENWYWHDSQGNRDTTKTDVLTRYKFTFALENTQSPDYFTEKRYQAYAAASVPSVWKNDNSVHYLPGGPESAIFPEDFNNDPVLLSKHLLAARLHTCTHAHMHTCTQCTQCTHTIHTHTHTLHEFTCARTHASTHTITHTHTHSKDDNLYANYTKWKKLGIAREFVKIMFKSTDFAACRICELAANLK